MKILSIVVLLLGERCLGDILLDLTDFGPCLIRLNYFGKRTFQQVAISRDIFTTVIMDNRRSSFLLKTIIGGSPMKKELIETEKCVVDVVLTIPTKDNTNWHWSKIEHYIFANKYAYRANYESSIILLRPDNKIKFPPESFERNCKLKTISIRIFLVAVQLTYQNPPSIKHTKWSFYCYFCSTRVWVGLQEIKGMSEFARLSHLSLRETFHQIKPQFLIATSEVRLISTSCPSSSWLIPKHPCTPERRIPNFITSILNVSLQDAPKQFNFSCGIISLGIMPTPGLANSTIASLRFKYPITVNFKYCEPNGPPGRGSLQFWAWVTPFKAKLWAALLLTMLLTGATITLVETKITSQQVTLYPKTFFANLFAVAAIHMRQVFGVNTSLKWTIHMIMIVTLAVYETYFTSTVVVPIKVENNFGFATLLKMGYKIAFQRMSLNRSQDISRDPYLNRYEYDFERLGISGWVKDDKYLYELQNRTQLFGDLLYKWKIMADITVISVNKERSKAQLRKENAGGEVQCRFAPETFLQTNTYEVAFVNVRVEILSLLGAAREFGFYNFWTKYEIDWEVYKLRNETRSILKERKVFVDSTEMLRFDDLIRVNNLFSLFLIFTAGLTMALVIFIGESLHQYCKNRVEPY
ncbi:hypothetical protein Fcan01_21024 [Folsomia candida]|uniref:Ionotropic glutamate receptor C-terminal domain-containing protein n=1 Tax=Folsomia candida TaxID=158441 RepID=A0A226DGS4_FOLCA|nr:hypothetical protein Fcan01_21024 [Folsomia candida]